MNVPALYEQLPARLLACNVEGHKKAMITLRVGTATVTFGLTKKDMADWIGVFQAHHDQMTDSGLIVPGPQIVLPPGMNGAAG